ncbi:MAG: (2Fe-2S)-binding protein [Halanaerobium sp.]|nr:(2Fe-2S)-binding protein [Halanaerobium sp.]
MPKVNVTVNGKKHQLEVPPQMSLVEMLRERLDLLGTKEGCGNGECGACTILMDGEAVRSCLVLAAEADGSEIITIEGLNSPEGLHPIQEAFLAEDAVQCGFCTPGFVMAVKSLLDRADNPTEEEVKEALGGHLCRCTGYEAIFRAVKRLVNS